jgi:hypothetical protein
MNQRSDPNEARDDPAPATQTGGAPATDPTNPHRQEAAGVNATAERTNDRKVSEPGLTPEDRKERDAKR